MLGACSRPYRRRFVRVRGLRSGFSGSHSRVSAGLRALFSDILGVAGVRAFGIRIIVRVLAGDLEVAGGLGGPGRALGA